MQSFARILVLALAALGPLGATRTGAQAPSPAKQGAAPAGRPAVEPKAAAILKAACAALEGAKAMSFDALSTYQHAARNGQPLYYSVLNHVTMQRPDKLRVITDGDGVPDEFYYNGKQMMAYVPSADVVAIADAPPTIDEMLNFAWDKAAIYFPFDDVITSDPCAVFTEAKVGSAFYVGQSKVIGGTTTDMVAVAGPGVQAELWLGAEDHLPRLVRVTYPHEPGHALYETAYSNWHLSDGVDPGIFVSDKATHAKPIPFAPPGAGQAHPGPRPHAKPTAKPS
ncbi:MAG TPA: DUF2092 domain-containing protein [Acetobacteraceae bacterium]|nr:DUF2092 domain-containing protein [Acetobacteraceae bacterium]